MDLKSRTRALKIEIRALQLAMRSPETPAAVKIAGGLLVAYALSPIDLIPDFIPVLGYLDDLILLPLGVFMLRRLIPHHVLEECRTTAEAERSDPESG